MEVEVTAGLYAGHSPLRGEAGLDEGSGVEHAQQGVDEHLRWGTSFTVTHVYNQHTVHTFKKTIFSCPLYRMLQNAQIMCIYGMGERQER